ncbi:MAG: hypothetical protein GXY05_00920 [Clostridiales bacterium]|nr:hypothetical protein [Clostridiales bacterium]
MRAAQICALKRGGKVIGFEAEPFVPDEAGYVKHKGGLMEYSAISRFKFICNDKTGTKPVQCHGNIPMADLAYIHIKLMNAMEILADTNRKKAIAADESNGLSPEQRTALMAESTSPQTYVVYQQTDKILTSRRDADGHCLVYDIIITCDPSRNAPFIFTVRNFYSTIESKSKGTMTHVGPKFNPTNVVFYATEAEAVNVIERMYEFARDFANNTFAKQLEIMKKLNQAEKDAVTSGAAPLKLEEDDDGQDKPSDSPEPPDDEAPAAETPAPEAPAAAKPPATVEKPAGSTASTTQRTAPAARPQTPIPRRQEPVTYDPNGVF